MTGDADTKAYQRPAAPMERLLTRSPFCIVTVVARIKGLVTPEALRAAVDAVQRRHPHLRARLVDDEHHNPWFTSEGAGPIPIDVTQLDSDDRWIEIVREASKQPFAFEDRPPARFFLLQAPDACDLIIQCHHFICDGISMAFLARDILECLGDPSRALEVLPDPVPIDLGSIPEEVSLNPIARFAIGRINRKWLAEPVYFDQRDYEALTEGYWRRFDHQVLTVELSGSQTRSLVERCRSQGVTVNTALAAAFTGAQAEVLDRTQFHPKLAVAADLRDRLREPAGRVMGFYAGAVSLDHKPDARKGFWEDARTLHARLQGLYTNKNLFKDALTWSHLEPSILEAINFKKLGQLTEPSTPANRKLQDFASRKDVVQAILQRDKAESLERPFMGTALTNLGRLDIPTRYGSLELERLFVKPGGAFPLASLNLLVGGVTAAGRLSLVLEYIEDRVDRRSMEAVKARALELLFEEQ